MFSLLVLGNQKWLLGGPHQLPTHTLHTLRAGHTLPSSTHNVSPASLRQVQQLRVPVPLGCQHNQHSPEHSSGTPDIGYFDIHVALGKLTTSAFSVKGENRKSLECLHRFTSHQQFKCT